ncbi:MAG: sigma-70 family RNA polymerase sigma factor [Rhodothermales bacterium]
MSSFDALHALKRNLPFAIDDIDRVNALYADWLRHRRPADIRVIDLWTYCFVWRYLLTKFLRDPSLNEVDLDSLLGRIYEQVVDKRHSLQNRDRYASWVSVVCHNQYVNYRRLTHPEMIRGLPPETALVEEPAIQHDDVLVLYRALTAAIGRLPEYLRDVCELKVVHGRTYEEIGRLTEKNIVVVRSYINRSLQRLRADPDFVLFCRHHFDEESANEGTHRPRRLSGRENEIEP